MEPENPILKQLTSNVPSTSQLTVVDISHTEICLEIRASPHHQAPSHPKDSSTEKTKPRSKSKPTSKQYRIKFENDRQF